MANAGKAGALNHALQVVTEGETRRQPEGFKVELDKDGWRH